ncbi:MAG: hypothetical protein DAHOPDDO_00601 [Ignavibacteriaceae bacterium]|nr:hypothetical protein [Ignavibacteriaceae bacterium]
MNSVIPIQSRIDRINFQKLKEVSKKKGISISMLIRIILINYTEGLNNDR